MAAHRSSASVNSSNNVSINGSSALTNGSVASGSQARASRKAMAPGSATHPLRNGTLLAPAAKMSGLSTFMPAFPSFISAFGSDASTTSVSVSTPSERKAYLRPTQTPGGTAMTATTSSGARDVSPGHCAAASEIKLRTTQCEHCRSDRSLKTT
eukprot:3934135-Rhodomonas_salina.3